MPAAYAARQFVGRPVGVERHSAIFQTSTINALVESVYDGDVTFAELARHGDFGLGTLNALYGEMVALDGRRVWPQDFR